MTFGGKILLWWLCAPGTPPITDEESEFYLRQALDKNLTCEVALAMRSSHRLKQDKSQEEYCDQIRSYALNTYLGHLKYALTASLTIPILASNQIKRFPCRF